MHICLIAVFFFTAFVCWHIFIHQLLISKIARNQDMNPTRVLVHVFCQILAIVIFAVVLVVT